MSIVKTKSRLDAQKFLEFSQENKKRASLLEFERYNDTLQKVENLKLHFLRNVTHELKTPLTAIIGFSELLLERLEKISLTQQKEFLAQIIESSHHLLDLINSILSLAKFEANQFEFHPEKVDVQKIIQEVIETLKPKALMKEISIKIRAHENHVQEAFLDRYSFRQVAFNYLSNAIEFTPPKGEVSITTFCHENKFRLEIEDSGVGISTSDVKKLFQKFYQLDHYLNKGHPGLGIGLAVVKLLVEAQGGEIGVLAKPDSQGSLFYASWPVLPCASPSKK